MEVNWPAVATVTVPVITYALGAWSERRGTRLVSYYSHVAGINGAWPNGQQVHVNTHTVVLRNAGRRMATNLRLTHANLPLFTIWPPIAYSTEQLPNGSTDIVIPKLIRGEQITVHYLYFPPMTFDQVHQGIKCDQGFANPITVLLQRQYPKWFQYVARALLLVGMGAVTYWLVRAAQLFMQLNAAPR